MRGDEEHSVAWGRLMRARAAERLARDDYRSRPGRLTHRDNAIRAARRDNATHRTAVFVAVSAVCIALGMTVGLPAPVPGVVGGVLAMLSMGGLNDRCRARVAEARRRHPEPEAEEVLRARYEAAHAELAEAEADPATLPADYTTWTAEMEQISTEANDPRRAR